jgi:hypothetical protein
MSTELVNVDNFARAETDRMLATIQRDAGSVNRCLHNRQPMPLDHQPVIRMNRDTLYSGAVVNITGAATVTIPEVGGRYVSVMVVNQDHYVNRILHLIATAAAGDGLPENEAYYLDVNPDSPSANIS